MSTKVTPIAVSAAGGMTIDVPAQGEILAVGLAIGTLDTPDITITDLDTGAAIFSKSAIAASGRWHPRAAAQTVAGVDTADAAGPPETNVAYVPPVCLHRAHVVVAGAGNATKGTLYIYYR